MVQLLMNAPSAIAFDPEKYESTQRRLTSSSAFWTFEKSARDVAFIFTDDDDDDNGDDTDDAKRNLSS
jgi:hypothetical protein